MPSLRCRTTGKSSLLKMPFARKFREKYMVLFLLLTSLLFFVYHEQHKFHHGSTKSNTVHLQHLRTFNKDMNETYLRFHKYEQFIDHEKMTNEQSKGKIAKEFKEDVKNAECSTPPFLLIEIHSHPKNFVSRQAIRLSWGNKDFNEKRNYKIIFLLGKVKNHTIEQMVRMEARRTRDIVQGDFLDIYNNLYKKMVLSLKWPLKNCPARYILKTDEDCYVNTDILLTYLEQYDAIRGSKPLYMGRRSTNVMVVRDPSDRYYVSKDRHPLPTYTPYVSGGGYVFSGFLLGKLYEASKVFPLFPVEDACFGSLMTKIGVQPKNNFRFLPFITCVFLKEFSDKDPLDRPVCEFLGPIIIHGLKPLKQLEINFHVKLLMHAPMLCKASEKNGWLKSRKICG